ncbi:G protein-coupled receptor kinase 3-like [Bolinopsis microptera]|uniref:G protein-coupled receptor kinase 3-like n=1 Tax=Bolinopsis microptera TaxID=2820187 RepID=UPI00307B01E6
MADLERTLADISYIITVNEPNTTKPITLPDPSVHFVVEKYLEENEQISFDIILSERIGYTLFKRFIFDGYSGFSKKCIDFYEMISEYRCLDCTVTRKPIAKEIYKRFIMPDLLAMDQSFDSELASYVNDCLSKDETDLNLFDAYNNVIKEYLILEEFPTFILSNHYTRYLQWKFVEINGKIKKDDFVKHRIIGRGGFGEVHGCLKIDTGHMFAIKYLNKKRLKKKGGKTTAFEEREMLLKFDSPFIVGLNYAFQTEEKLCFVLDLMRGGDLSYHLNQRGQFSEDETRFYAVEIILGLELMHSKDIVYRDLKPANILMDDAGHIKISDLGLATDFRKKKPKLAVGTPGYRAPEVLRGKPYDYCADWFTFGCTLVKLLTGKCPPTPSAESNSLQPQMVYPDDFTPELVSLLTGLLRYIPEKRLGYNGAAEVKIHGWFQSVDWTLANKLGLEPPFAPSKGEVHALDPVDIGTFNDDDIRDVELTKEDEEFFKSFDISPSDRWQREVLGDSTWSSFDVANQNADKWELNKRKSCTFYCGANSSLECKCTLEGYMLKLGGMFLTSWQKSYFSLLLNHSNGEQTLLRKWNLTSG